MQPTFDLSLWHSQFYSDRYRVMACAPEAQQFEIIERRRFGGGLLLHPTLRSFRASMRAAAATNLR